MNNEKFMKRALELAGKARCDTLPNPNVGAVIVKNNRIIGEGYHRGPGTRHGEIDAITNATESVKGATLYTSLEPCASVYTGKRQPPCTHRIVKEGIKEVVIAMRDPNPEVNGQGINYLLEKGVKVTTGIMESEALSQNKVFIVNMEEKRPYIHIKIAQTLDGKIATRQGDSKWITDGDARSHSRLLRSEYGSVLIGAGTLKADNPDLTGRNNTGKKVNRFILSRDLNFSTDSKIFKDVSNPVFIISDLENPINKNSITVLEKKGVRFLHCKSTADRTFDLNHLMPELYKKGVHSVLIEGGAVVFTSFLKQGLFDEISFYTAPLICGSGVSGIGELNSLWIKDLPRLKRVQSYMINDQIVINGLRS